MAHHRTLTDREEFILKRLHAHEFTDGMIADTMGIDRKTVRHIRLRLGLDAVCAPGRYKGKHKKS